MDLENSEFSPAPDDDLGADIAAAFAADSGADGADHADGAEPPDQARPSSDASTTDDTGRPEDAATDAADTGEALRAPVSWAEPAKAVLSTLPEDAQRVLLTEIQKRERDIDARLRGNATIEKAIEPYRATLQARGVDAGQYVSNLLAWNAALSGDPVQALTKLHARTISDAGQARQVIAGLAQRFNLSEFDLISDDEQHRDAGARTPDPQVLELQRRLEAREVQEALREWDEVKARKTPEGRPLYPYAEELRPDVMRLIRANPQLTYAEALDAAQYINPQVREKVLGGLMSGGKRADGGKGGPRRLPRGTSDRLQVAPASAGDIDADLRAAYAAAGVRFSDF